MSRAGLEKTPHEVASMFDGVAARYDLTNTVLAMRQDVRWRKLVAEALDLRAGQTVLDLAAGTGTSSEPFADAGVHTVPATSRWACSRWATGAPRPALRGR